MHAAHLSSAHWSDERGAIGMKIEGLPLHEMGSAAALAHAAAADSA